MNAAEMRALAHITADRASAWTNDADRLESSVDKLAYATCALAAIQIANYWRESANDIERSYE